MSFDILSYPLNETKYTAEDAQMYHSPRTTGVYSSEEDFVVTPVLGVANSVSVSSGLAWIRPGKFSGFVVANRSSSTISLLAPHAFHSRIDRIVIRYIVSEFKVVVDVKSGGAAANPVAKELQRDSDMFELGIADITVTPNTITLTPENVTDTRLNESLCGIMSDGVTKIPTQALVDAWNAWFVSAQNQGVEDRAALEAEFQEWFVKIQGILSEDALGELTLLANEALDQANAAMTQANTATTKADSALTQISALGFPTSTTFTVGTSTAGHGSKDVDYLCTGTNDQNIINQAIQALPSVGGQIIIREGKYSIASLLLINKDRVTITGMGKSTQLVRTAAGSVTNYSTIAITGEHCVIENMYIDGVKGSYGGTYNRGVSTAGSYTDIRDVSFVDCSYGIYTTAGTGHIFSGNHMLNSGIEGITLSGINNCIISSNVILYTLGDGIRFGSGSYVTFNSNICSFGGGSGLSTSGQYATFVGNSCMLNSSYGVWNNGSSLLIGCNTMVGNGNGAFGENGTGTISSGNLS